MKTKITSIILMLVLSGCTLAKAPETILENNQDIVGIYITTESLIAYGTLLDLDDHSQSFALINKYEKNGASYVESIVSGKFYDSLMDVNVNDEMITNTFTAKVPVLTSASDVFINHYEILKTSEDAFILGNSMNGIGLNGDGTAGVDFDFTKQTEINGQKSSETLRFDLDYVPTQRLISLKLVELDIHHAKLLETDMMETSEVNLQETTQYMLVEEERMNSDGTMIRDVSAYARKQNEVIEHSIIRTSNGEVFASPDTLRFIP